MDYVAVEPEFIYKVESINRTAERFIHKQQERNKRLMC